MRYCEGDGPFRSSGLADRSVCIRCMPNCRAVIGIRFSVVAQLRVHLIAKTPLRGANAMSSDTASGYCHALESIVGESSWTKSLRTAIVRIARYPSSVLITGPSGTGKELIARAIHATSTRRDGPLVPVNCASIPETLFASHMFGHKKGAFTNAHFASLGAFRAADGGTLFLDEIGDMDFESQARMLRAIQERSVVPLGGHEEIPVDVRIIAATNHNLRCRMDSGKFREDLYYRLNVVQLDSIPLKERKDDIDVLAKHFLAKISFRLGAPLKRFTDDAFEWMRAYSWPGNVRELENSIERAILATEREAISAEVLSLNLVDRDKNPEFQDASQTINRQTINRRASRHESDASSMSTSDHWPTMSEIERDHIRRTLKLTSNNQSAAARLLEIDRHQLIRKIKKYGLDLGMSRRGRPQTKASSS